MLRKWTTLFKTKVVPRWKYFVKECFDPKYLFYTNMFTSTASFTVGDVLEQRLESVIKKKEPCDYARTYRMTVVGLANGLFSHYWYTYLDTRFPGKAINRVVIKILLDQFVGTPIAIAIFFFVLGWLEGKTNEEIVDEVRLKGWNLYVAEWVVYPAAQFFNFYFLPPKYRVLYTNAVSLCFDSYVSYVKNSPHFEQKQKEK